MSLSKKQAVGDEHVAAACAVPSVKMWSGEWVMYGVAMLRLYEALEMVDFLIDGDWIKEFVGIDLDDPDNAHIHEGIKTNPNLRVVCDESGYIRVGLRNTLDVYNQNSLRSLFGSRLEGGEVRLVDGSTALGAHEDDLKNAYRGVEVDLDRMVARGEVCVVPDRETKSKRVFFPAPEGMAAASQLIELWHSKESELPHMVDVRKALKEKGLYYGVCGRYKKK